jgi:hypothetical protein
MSESNWDPPKNQREFVRHRLTGDLGWLVRRDGREHVKYDRPDHDQTVPVRRDDKGNFLDWVREKEPAPLTSYQVAIVAYEADRALDRYLGNLRRPKAWIDMSEDDRRRWANDGPKDESGPRRKVFDAIAEALEPFTK